MNIEPLLWMKNVNTSSPADAKRSIKNIFRGELPSADINKNGAFEKGGGFVKRLLCGICCGGSL